MPPLLQVRGDAVYRRIRRRGRFCVDLACYRSLPHFRAAVQHAQEKMVWGLAKRGLRYVDKAWELKGPLPHLFVALDATVDPGPQTNPPIDGEGNLDQAWAERWEKAEKARVARDLADSPRDLVDFQLTTEFEQRCDGDLVPLNTLPHSVLPSRKSALVRIN